MQNIPVIAPITDEILNFLAAGATPEQILAFKPSNAVQARASELLERNRRVKLNEAETAELEELARMNHFMMMLKIRARKCQLQTGHSI
jgi:hypothetical protein